MCEADMDYICGSSTTGAISSVIYGTVTNCYVSVKDAGSRSCCGLADSIDSKAVISNCLTTGEFKNAASYINNAGGNNNIKNCYYTQENLKLSASNQPGSDSTIKCVPDMSDGNAAYELQKGAGSEELIWAQTLTGDDADSTPVLAYFHPEASEVLSIPVVDRDSDTEVAVIAGNIGQNVALKEINKDNGMYVYDTFTDEEGNEITSVDINKGVTQKIYTTLADSSLIKKSEYDDNIAGDGTQESPYEISSAAQLRYIRYEMEYNKSYMSASYILNEDIDMGEPDTANFEPIGTVKNSFTGTFDGKGHSISNLNIVNETEYTGLFGYVSGNVVIKDLTLHGKIDAGNSYVGSFVGFSNGTLRISGCHSDMDITTNGENYAGGIAGAELNENANPPAMLGRIE